MIRLKTITEREEGLHYDAENMREKALNIKKVLE